MPANELNRFYARLADCIQTYELFTLGEVDGRHPWPKQGVYFFFDANEPTPYPGLPGRIVRVGSHGVAKNTNSTLWSRLSQHRGSLSSGGGNHRGSIFRRYVGIALGDPPPHWRNQNAKKAEVGASEHEHERRVSDYIRQLPFTVIDIPGTPDKNCFRAVFERQCIAYLSWAWQAGLIEGGKDWLGLRTNNSKISQSGLWNVENVWTKEQAPPKAPTWPHDNTNSVQHAPAGELQTAIQKSSGNVYEDIGVENEGEMRLKAQLAAALKNLIESQGLTRMQAAETIGLPQSKLSCLLKGQFRGISISKMMEAINCLGRDVQIVIGPEKQMAGPGTSGLVEVLHN